MSGVRVFFRVLCVAAVLGFGLSLVFDTPAAAQSKRVTVEAGKRTVIDVISLYAANTCATLIAPPEKTQQPEHGRLSVKWGPYRLREGHCKGRNIKIIVVEYTPNRGYRGKDTAGVVYKGMRSVYRQSETMTRFNRKYRITVK